MTRSEVRWILRLWRPFRGWLALILAATFTATIVRVAMPLALKRAFDGFAAGMTETGLARAVGLYLVLGFLEWALATCLVFLRGTMNFRFESAARENAYARLVRHAPGFFQRFRTGDLVTRLTDDVSEKLSWFICSGIFRAIAALGTIVFAVAMMVRLDPWLTLLTAGPLPVLVFLFIRTGTLLDRRFDAVQQRISDLNGGIEATVSGIRVVKAYGREAAEERTFDRLAGACRAAEIDAAKSQTIMESLYGHVWQLGVVTVLLAGGAAVIQGRMTLGTFVAFDAYVLMLIFPMLDVGTFFVRGRQSGVSILRLRELEETPPEIVERRRRARADVAPRGNVRFDGVSYVYASPDAGSVARVPGGADGDPIDSMLTRVPDSETRRGDDRAVERIARAEPESVQASGSIPDRPGGRRTDPETNGGGTSSRARPALSGVTIDVRPGQMLAVVGRVAAGKSTLLRLLPRIVDPTGGRVLFDGADLRDLPVGDLRRSIGYVPQEPVLFSGTIRENIRFARAWISDDDVASAARIARLEKDLAGFADGLGTRVGVRGVALSGGQKQRVALARALAGRPKVLALDDATAALDAETEAALWGELRSVLPDLAMIVVTHRTATLERADRILVLDDGRLAEQGTHAELDRGGALYRSIYRRHLLEERVGESDPAA